MSARAVGSTVHVRARLATGLGVLVVAACAFAIGCTSEKIVYHRLLRRCEQADGLRILPHRLPNPLVGDEARLRLERPASERARVRELRGMPQRQQPGQRGNRHRGRLPVDQRRALS